jgi:hypothetical protein
LARPGRLDIAARAVIGYGEKWIDAETETYVNVAKLRLEAFAALIAEVGDFRKHRHQI